MWISNIRIYRNTILYFCNKKKIFKNWQISQELAPLCVDSESLERVERVKQQLEMIERCSRRISCCAETLGAVQQERRVSRAVLLADKYLQTLRYKCERFVDELSKTKYDDTFSKLLEARLFPIQFSFLVKKPFQYLKLISLRSKS